MPTYDYRCNGCEHEFELFQAMSAPVKKKCPECGKLKLERLIGIGSAVMFKGSGFYETDYRSESYKKGAEAEKKAKEPKKDAGSEKKSEPKKTETKPAEKKSKVETKK
ncbi:MAG: zinc ribbon domain-containing protein [Phycisphaerales bacterium]|nr:zinc ribbon domain-containing protein [Phycisphaerales bacterium]